MPLPSIEWLCEDEIWEAISSLKEQYENDPICIINFNPIGYILKLEDISYFFEDNVLLLASVIIRSIIQGHPLQDGKKGWACFSGHTFSKKTEFLSLRPTKLFSRRLWKWPAEKYGWNSFTVGCKPSARLKNKLTPSRCSLLLRTPAWLFQDFPPLKDHRMTDPALKNFFGIEQSARWDEFGVVIQRPAPWPLAVAEHPERSGGSIPGGKGFGSSCHSEGVARRILLLGKSRFKSEILPPSGTQGRRPLPSGSGLPQNQTRFLGLRPSE